MKQKTLVIATGAFLLPRSLSFAKPAKKTTQLFNGFIDSDEEGVVAFGGKLDIRPPYQRKKPAATAAARLGRFSFRSRWLPEPKSTILLASTKWSPIEQPRPSEVHVQEVHRRTAGSTDCITRAGHLAARTALCFGPVLAGGTAVPRTLEGFARYFFFAVLTNTKK